MTGLPLQQDAVVALAGSLVPPPGGAPMATRSPLIARLRGDRFFQLGLVLVAVVVLAAVSAPWLAPYNPIAGDLGGVPRPPGRAFPFRCRHPGQGRAEPGALRRSPLPLCRPDFAIVSVAPGLAIGLAVLGFNLVGDVLCEVTIRG